MWYRLMIHQPKHAIDKDYNLWFWRKSAKFSPRSRNLQLRIITVNKRNHKIYIKKTYEVITFMGKHVYVCVFVRVCVYVCGCGGGGAWPIF